MADFIYLDHAATCPVDPEVAQGLAERQLTAFGNPSSSHPAGRAARQVHDAARVRLARLLGGRPDEVVFTGGGTEAIGLAMLGTAGTSPGHVAYSAVEHACVVANAARLVERSGWRSTVIPVDGWGRVTPEAVVGCIDARTRLVAVMLANNEIGTVNDIAAIARVVRQQSPRARLVVDAVQAFGKLDFSARRLDADCVAVTAHKLHGPVGIGALWTRVPIAPVYGGGGQEGGRRSGTQSAPLAWAFAEAAARQRADMGRITALRDQLWADLRQRLPDARLTGAPIEPGDALDPPPARLGNNLHLCVPGVPGGPLLNALSAAGLCASAGSACGKGRFSTVLRALGRSADDGAYLRLTPGRFTTAAEIERAAQIIATAAAELRAVYTA